MNKPLSVISRLRDIICSVLVWLDNPLNLWYFQWNLRSCWLKNILKILLNSFIAKYGDLSVWQSHGSIICLLLWLRQIIDLLATDKSRYFAQPRSIIIVNYSFISQARPTVGFSCGFSSNMPKIPQIWRKAQPLEARCRKEKKLWNIGFPVLTTHTVSHTVRGRFSLKDECLISVPFQAGRSANSK